MVVRVRATLHTYPDLLTNGASGQFGGCVAKTMKKTNGRAPAQGNKDSLILDELTLVKSYIMHQEKWPAENCFVGASELLSQGRPGVAVTYCGIGSNTSL